PACGRQLVLVVGALPRRAALCPLSLHDALPISVTSSGSTRTSCASATSTDALPPRRGRGAGGSACTRRLATHGALPARRAAGRVDRKSTRLNSSHVKISYAVFCSKKKTHTHAPT